MPTSKVYNKPTSFVSNEAAEEFIRRIQGELDKGFGFVPLIGAGFSAPSGLPLIWEVERYLQRCIALSLGLDLDQPSPGIWSPREHRWPSLVEDHEEDHSDKLWIKKVKDLLEKAELDGSDNQYVKIVRQAHGAMHEWTSALQFLSRLVRRTSTNPDSQGDTLFLESPQQDVIDACIRTIMTGKQPTLGHRMLAGLGGLLRLDIILTTNFDDLMEQAFIEARNPLTVFDIHLNSSLPPLSAVQPQRSLIKLHGDRYSLRADFTVDAEPKEADRESFLSYLAYSTQKTEQERRTTREPAKTPQQHRNHLFVAGCSGKERRLKSFVTSALSRYGTSLKIFWLCYSEADVQNAREVARDGEATSEQFHILRFPNHGLLLLQLFQSIRRCLPPQGIIFPSASRLFLPPLVSKVEFKRTMRHQVFQDLINLSNNLLAGNIPECCKLVRLTGEGAIGVTPVASVFCQHVSDFSNSLWIDMNDISTTDDFFEKLLDAANYRVGSEQWMPVYVGSDTKSKGDEFRRILRRSSGDWYIFINAREKPGINTLVDAATVALANGWLDKDGDEVRSFIKLVNELCGDDSPHVVVVLTYRYSDNGGIENFFSRSHRLPEPLNLKSGPGNVRVVEHDANIVEAVLNWAAKSLEQRRFIHSLCLMQRTRYLATVWSTACLGIAQRGSLCVIQPDNGRAYQEWLDDLVKTGLMRRKAGGFIWMHSAIRTELRIILESPREKLLEGRYSQYFRPIGKLGAWIPADDAPGIHQQLAEWYRVVYAACDTPAAIFEACYHLCQASVAILRVQREARMGIQVRCAPDWPDPSELVDNANAMLQINSFRIQTRGYSRGSCRQLEYIGDSVCKELSRVGEEAASPMLNRAITNLNIRCREIMRNIAREVSEWGKLEERQETIIRLLIPGAMSGERASAETSSRRFQEFLLRLSSEDKSTESSQNLLLAWLRWCRWQGMIYISDRRYTDAMSVLQLGLSSVLSPNHGGEASTKTMSLYIDELYSSLQNSPSSISVFSTTLSPDRQEPGRNEVLRHVVWMAGAHIHLLSVRQRLENSCDGIRPELPLMSGSVDNLLSSAHVR